MERLNRGFTLIEVLLIVAALVIVAGISIVAMNPARQLADARDAERRSEVGVIWSAIHQYALDNNGELPAGISTGNFDDCTRDDLNSQYTICRNETCPVQLTELLEDARYLTEIPVDPVTYTEDLSGYSVLRDDGHQNRITVCAPGTESGEVIHLP